MDIYSYTRFCLHLFSAGRIGNLDKAVTPLWTRPSQIIRTSSLKFISSTCARTDQEIEAFQTLFIGT